MLLLPTFANRFPSSHRFLWPCGALLFVLLAPSPAWAANEGANAVATVIPAHMRCAAETKGGTGSTHVAPRTSRAVELTFMKSRPGQRGNLVRYIVANWFAMDSAARARGLLDGFSVLESGVDGGPWDVVVSTSYRDTRGHEGIAEAFDLIRKSHQEVLIEGRGLDDLGSIIDSQTVFEHPGRTSC